MLISAIIVEIVVGIMVNMVFCLFDIRVEPHCVYGDLVARVHCLTALMQQSRILNELNRTVTFSLVH